MQQQQQQRQRQECSLREQNLNDRVASLPPRRISPARQFQLQLSRHDLNNKAKRQRLRCSSQPKRIRLIRKPLALRFNSSAIDVAMIVDLTVLFLIVSIAVVDISTILVTASTTNTIDYGNQRYIPPRSPPKHPPPPRPPLHQTKQSTTSPLPAVVAKGNDDDRKPTAVSEVDEDDIQRKSNERYQQLMNTFEGIEDDSIHDNNPNVKTTIPIASATVTPLSKVDLNHNSTDVGDAVSASISNGSHGNSVIEKRDVAKQNTIPPPPPSSKQQQQSLYMNNSTAINPDAMDDNVRIESESGPHHHQTNLQQYQLPPHQRNAVDQIVSTTTRQEIRSPTRRMQQQQQSRIQQPQPSRFQQQQQQQRSSISEAQPQRRPVQNQFRPSTTSLPQQQQNYDPRQRQQESHRQKQHQQKNSGNYSWRRGVWRTLERGLDGLANIEETVSGHAKQLASEAQSKVLGGPNKVRPNRSSQQQQQHGQQQQNSRPLHQRKQKNKPVEQMDMSRFQKKLPPPGTVPSNQQHAIKQKNLLSGPPRDGRMVQGGAASDTHVERQAETLYRPEEANVPPYVPYSNTGNSDIPPLPPQMQQRPPQLQQPNQTQQQHEQSVPPSSSNKQSRKEDKETVRNDRFSFDDDDDDDSVGLVSKLTKFIPSFRLPQIRRHSRDYDDATMDAWDIDEEKSSGGGTSKRSGLFKLFQRKESSSFDGVTIMPRKWKSKEEKVITPSMEDLLERCKGQTIATKKKSVTLPPPLLTMNEKDQCTEVGRRIAIMDGLFLAFIIAGIRQVPGLEDIPFPATVVEALTSTLSKIGSSVATASCETWAPHLFVAAYLSSQTRRLRCDRRISKLKSQTGEKVLDETMYGSLFLRIASPSMRKHTNHRTMNQSMERAAVASVTSNVEIARLRSFVLLVVSSLLIFTVLGFVPAVFDAMSGIWKILLSRSEFADTSAVLTGMKTAIRPAYRQIVDAVTQGLITSPLQLTYRACVFLALVAVAMIPTFDALITSSAPRTEADGEDAAEDEEYNDQQLYNQYTEVISNLASSGADRLSLLAVNGRLDKILERWRAMIKRPTNKISGSTSLRSKFQHKLMLIASFLVLGSPLLLRMMTSLDLATPNAVHSIFPEIDSLLDVSLILIFAQSQTWKLLSAIGQTLTEREQVEGFTKAFTTATESRIAVLKSQPKLEMQAQIQPGAGLEIHDMWTSHATKRTWAVRGANLACRGGEVVLLLGDDGSGKSRLMTSIVETLLPTPQESKCTILVKGGVKLSGVDSKKWDTKQLMRRVGVFVNDVRSTSDSAQLLSRLALEEILDPCDGIRNVDASRSPGKSERDAMMLALKLTGLYSTLLRRLPMKMSTVVTANDSDDSLFENLSPSEWSKLLLARVIAQSIYDNENSVGSMDSVDRSLIGSLLVLDDLTLHMSEIEEAQILNNFRRSHAAVLISSHRWSTGRFADRIAIVRDGAIVETGTHNELLTRGPQHSIYAAKWHAMR